jgi:hypothetical protein
VSNPAPSSLFSFAADTSTRIDEDAGIILGVAVITAGPALGHFDWSLETPLPLFADNSTLSEVMTCANGYAGGLKVKFNHGSGIGDIVGRLTAFRIDGNVLRADFHALAASPHRAYLFEIASTIPESFGLSISFSGKPERGKDRAFARCSEIYSADFVDEPAANPTGLFQRGGAKAPPAQYNQPNPNNLMEDEVKKDPVAELAASVASLLARIEALEVNGSDKKKDEEMAKHDMPTEEKMNAIADKAALAALKTYTAQFGALPAKVSHEAKREDKAEKKFEAVVAAKAIELNSKAKAISWAVANHPAEHKAYLGRVAAGETITL